VVQDEDGVEKPATSKEEAEKWAAWNRKKGRKIIVIVITIFRNIRRCCWVELMLDCACKLYCGQFLVIVLLYFILGHSMNQSSRILHTNVMLLCYQLYD